MTAFEWNILKSTTEKIDQARLNLSEEQTAPALVELDRTLLELLRQPTASIERNNFNRQPQPRTTERSARTSKAGSGARVMTSLGKPRNHTSRCVFCNGHEDAVEN